jgi:hypothetical protein
MSPAPDPSSGAPRRSPSAPLAVGLTAAAVAITLTLAGLWRGGLLTWRNSLLGIALGGGTWGIIAWAVAYTVRLVDEDMESGEDR